MTSSPRSPPSLARLDWRAILAALGVAFVTGLVTRTLLAPVPGIVASIVGIGVSGFLAGIGARGAGAYHGAAVGVGWVLLEAIGVAPTPAAAENAVADTVAVIAFDALSLSAATFGGWFAAKRHRSSSSGRGKAR